MSELARMCADAGLTSVRTYIASGNVVFKSRSTETKVKALLEQALRDYAGKPVGVMVRTGVEMAAVIANIRFQPRHRTEPSPSFSMRRRRRMR